MKAPSREDSGKYVSADYADYADRKAERQDAGTTRPDVAPCLLCSAVCFLLSAFLNLRNLRNLWMRSKTLNLIMRFFVIRF